MGYNKHTWTRGDVLTSDKLNQMEEGIANANKQADTLSSNLLKEEEAIQQTDINKIITSPVIYKNFFSANNNSLYAKTLTIGQEAIDANTQEINYTGTVTLNTAQNDVHGTTNIDELIVKGSSKLEETTIHGNTIIGQNADSGSTPPIQATDTHIYGGTTIEAVNIKFFGTIPTYTPIADSRNYGVQSFPSNGSLYVNVPWTDTNTTYSASTGLQLNDTTFSLKKATTNEIGGVRVGNNLTIDSDGILSAQVPAYGLASTSELGLIKIGNGLRIDSDGTLSAIASTYNNATTRTAGLMSAQDKSKLDNLDNVYIKIPDLSTLDTGEDHNYILRTWKRENENATYLLESIVMPNIPNTEGVYNYTLQMTVNVSNNNSKTVGYEWVAVNNGGE